MLPEGIPTVTVTGRYLFPDGRPLSGQVVWRAPALVTFADYDVILGGPVTVPLDEQGRFTVELPATDAPGMNPSGWSYSVAEQFASVAQNRVYQVLLPAETPEVDIADIAPTDPTTPTYVAVRGDSAYEVAVDNGFAGTEAEWLASLVGPQGAQGPQGDSAYTVAVDNGFVGTEPEWLASLEGPQGPQGVQGPQGDTGPQGAPGVVQSVNGQSVAAVVLDAADVGAVPDTAPGAPNGVAQLDGTGKVPAAQLPAAGGAVTSVNTQTGDVVLDAADVGALALTGGTVTGPVTLEATSNVTNLRLGDTSPSFGGGTGGVIAMQNAATAPTGNPSGIAMFAEGGRFKVRQSDGHTATLRDPSAFAPADLGFTAWTFDPALTDGTAQYCQIGYVYLMGIVLRETVTLSKVCFYTPGNGATQPNASSFAGLYSAAGTRVAVTTSLNNWFSVNEGATVECGLTANYTAAPGLYWVALLINGPATPTDGPGFARGASSGANPSGQARAAGVSFIRHGRLSTTGKTSLPTSFTPGSDIVPDANAIWAAVR